MDDGFIVVERQPFRILRNDAIVAGVALAVMAFFELIASGVSTSESGGTQLVTMGLSLLVISTLAIRRTHPVTFAWLTAVLAGAIHVSSNRIDLVVNVFVLMGVYSTAAYAARKWRFAGLASLPFALWVMASLLIVGRLPGQTQPVPEGMVAPDFSSFAIVIGVIIFAYLAAFGLGLARRGRLDVAVRERERQAMLEQDAIRLTELAVADERARISREMHDIIAHSLASIVTLAEGGRFAAQGNAELSRELFDKIASTGRDALTDVKRLLRAVDEAQDDSPAHGPEDIPELVSSAQLAGQPITLEVTGEPRKVPAGLGLAIYRVAQECITNVLKHAQGAVTQLRMDWRENELRFHCDNELTGGSLVSSSGVSSKGLQGMRERVELFDGSFDSAVVGDLFTVRAVWPLPDRQAGAES